MSTSKRRVFRIAAGTAGVLVFSLVGIATAGAVTPGRLAGYSAPPSGGPTQSAAVTFVVPSINCAPVKKKGVQVVVAGVRLEASSGDTGGGVALVCLGKTATYEAFIQINGTPVSTDLTVTPGDTFSTSASETASDASVTDTDGTQTQTSTGSGATITAEDVGDIAANCTGATCASVPEIPGKTHFSAGSINGLNLSTAGAVRGNLVDAAGQIEIKAANLTSGTAFTTAWKLSCSPTGVASC